MILLLLRGGETVSTEHHTWDEAVKIRDEGGWFDVSDIDADDPDLGYEPVRRQVAAERVIDMKVA